MGLMLELGAPRSGVGFNEFCWRQLCQAHYLLHNLIVNHIPIVLDHHVFHPVWNNCNRTIFSSE